MLVMPNQGGAFHTWILAAENMSLPGETAKKQNNPAVEG
jgi:hypothetical protein